MHEQISIEKKYQKLSDIEHVLLRPGMYVGSIKPHTEEVFLPQLINKQLKFNLTEITYNPGFLKLFDEIISNSVDEHKRNLKLNQVKIDINQKTGQITVWDNGGIPVEKHKEYDEWVPEMIFSNLKSGSNFDDTEERTVVGTNGVGSTLTNIFSNEFIVKTCDGKKEFHQVFSENLSKRSTPKITTKKQAYTQISWQTDFKHFGMTGIDDSSFKMLEKRIYDIAACNLKLKIVLNGTEIKFKSFQEYAELYTTPVFYEHSKNWKVGIGHSESGFKAVSFVNSVETKDGGTHVNYLTGQIINFVREQIKKKHKYDVKPSDIKQHLFLFIDATVINPAFSSQTKEKLITEVKDFGSSHEISDKLLKQILDSKITESILDWIQRKKDAEERAKLRNLNKTIDKKTVIKLIDAKKRGNREKCTLSLFEGDCLDPNTSVLCMDVNDGLINKPIKNINIGDYVITHTNKISKVIAKSSKINRLYNIKTNFGNVKASINHRFIMYDTLADNYNWVSVKTLLTDIHRYKFVYNKLNSITKSSEIINIKKNKNNIIITLNDIIFTASHNHKYLIYDLQLQEFNLVEAKNLNKKLHLIVFSNTDLQT